MIIKSTAVISKMLLPIVPALMSQLLCALIISILNGGHNVTKLTSTAPMCFLSFVAYKVIPW